MGLFVSKHDFAILEGFGSKNSEEQNNILQQAGMVPEEQDVQIADFLQINGELVGTIRGIVTTCVEKKTFEQDDYYRDLFNIENQKKWRWKSNTKTKLQL